MRRFVLFSVLVLVGCRSEQEKAQERAVNASRASVETTRASKLPVVELPLEDFDPRNPVLRIRAEGLELDARGALAEKTDVLPYFGKTPTFEPQQTLDALRPYGTDYWFLFPKAEAALKAFEETHTESMRVETTLVLEVAPDVPAVQVAALVNVTKLRTVLAVRDRDGELSALILDGPDRVGIEREGCVVAEQGGAASCIAPVVNLRASGAQLFGWKGFVDDECIQSPSTRTDAKPSGPIASAEKGCEFPVSSTEALEALAKAAGELAAVSPGCTHVVVKVEPGARWGDVTPLLAKLVAAKGAPKNVALWGLAQPLAACPAQPMRAADFAR